MISIDIDDRAVIAALTRLRDRVGEAGLRPALARIGEHLRLAAQVGDLGCLIMPCGMGKSA
jgi:hypothetical protein